MAYRIELEITFDDCASLIGAGLYREGQVVPPHELAATVAALFRERLAQLAGRAGQAAAAPVPTPADAGTPTGRALAALDLLKNLIGDSGELLPTGTHFPASPTHGVPVDRWKSAFRLSCVAGSASATRKAFKRAAARLEALGAVGIAGGFAWLAGAKATTPAPAECLPSAPAGRDNASALPPLPGLRPGQAPREPAPQPPPIFQRLAPAARPAEPGTGLRILPAAGNPMPEATPVFAHLRGAELVATAPASGPGRRTTAACRSRPPIGPSTGPAAAARRKSSAATNGDAGGDQGYGGAMTRPAGGTK
jgi:hypothetical protein